MPRIAFASKVISLVRREIPKIQGSSTALIVLIVVLVVLIIGSLSAVFYFLRQERGIGGQEARRRQRYNAQPLLDRDIVSNLQHSKKWYSYLWSSRDRYNHTQLDKPMERNAAGWIQPNSRVNDTEAHTLSRSDNQSGLLRNGSSGSESFVAGPRFYTHRTTSDDTSSVRYDPHDVRGLPYPEQFPISPRATTSEVESQLDSPTSSSPSSPIPRRIMKSPEPISSSTASYDRVRDSLTQLPPPVLASGSKFFESL